MTSPRRVLLIITGGIAAYKSLELIRLLTKDGVEVRAILTKGGEQFVTPLSVGALCGHEPYTNLWSLKDETEMGHIRLSRESDVIVVAPASADFCAKMAAGLADDLASTCILATDKPVLIAPAMNPYMWENAATKANIETLIKRGTLMIGPNAGVMACGETGLGRMVEPETLFQAITDFFKKKEYQPLKGKRAIVTSGPTHEPIDPVRYIANRSSGKQGHAIAAALAAQGATVTLISGPVNLFDPQNVTTIHVETAAQMHQAVESALPADIFIGAAAVADWAVSAASDKIKKEKGGMPPALQLSENPDILKSISAHAQRPALVIGFAAETNNVTAHAQSKLKTKGCDWILANDVGTGTQTFGGEQNRVTFLTRDGRVEDWPLWDKSAVALELARRIGLFFNETPHNQETGHDEHIIHHTAAE
ncbi:MAG: bifunctional phosphopantothenoylcysteine decarboxylase/phosphopantothenate--cysteine ligase CoaBC [Pseudobdellovibrionaceae bacterium]